MLVSSPRGFDRFLMTGGISNTSAWPDCYYTLSGPLGAAHLVLVPCLVGYFVVSFGQSLL